MSSRILLFLHLDRFYIDALNLDQGQCVVVHRDKTVLDLNTLASSRGVTSGMGLPEAKTLLGRDGVFIEWQEEPYGDAQRAWLDVCAIYSDVIEPVSQHEAFIDLSGHPSPAYIQENLIDELKSHGYDVRSGVGACRWVAEISAGLGNPPLACLDAPRFVSTLPVFALPIEEQWAQRLSLLGCQTIGDVARMSPESLRRQFGKAAYDIKRFAFGEGPSEVECAYPPDSLGDRFRFDGGADELSVFDNGLKSLAKSLGSKLSEKDLASEELEVWLEHEEGEVSHLSRKFTKPVGSLASLLVSLRLLCGAPERAVTLVRVRVSNLKKGRRVQKTLENMTSASSRSAASTSALAQVKAAFGDSSIQLGSEVAQPRWKQVRSAWRSANGWTWR